MKRRFQPLLLLEALLVSLLFGWTAGHSAIVEKRPFEPPGVGATGQFTFVEAKESGLTHINRYRDPRMWGNRYLAATAGATGTGLAAGDFTGDGWPDLFLAMREDQNRLYRNEGGLKFADVTLEAGIGPSLDWTTGVTAVDIEGDGDLDIYVCSYNSPNQLYINDGKGRFEEQAYHYGLDVWDASNAAFFADYDRDGDLDLYLQTNQLEEENRGYGQADYLFRNDGDKGFTEVTQEAGIKTGLKGATLGHSVLWIDFDEDGWQDIYVANDFEAPDFLYRNQRDGTFLDVAYRLPHVTYSSMGSDCGDLNNDGKIDMVITDMATNTYQKHVVSMLPNSIKTRGLSPSEGPAQVMKNSVFLNRGAGEFIDLAYAWELAASEWTWAVRLQDFDNDGWQDAFFTNGMLRQFHNADLSYQQDQLSTKAEKDAVFPRSPVLKEENLIYRNLQGRGFKKANQSWQLDHSGVSFGAVSCDFDRDGDLDIMYSNFNDTPTLWRNDAATDKAVQISLKAAGKNSKGIGAKVVARLDGQKQAQVLLSNRGYQSSEEAVLHFGLGENEKIDQLEIQWPDGTQQMEHNLTVGYRYHIAQDSTSSLPAMDDNNLPARFRLVSKETGLPVPTVQNETAPLSPLKPIPDKAVSQQLEADFNGDGALDTLTVTTWKAPELILNTTEGSKVASEAWGLDPFQGYWESAAILDANEDGLPDVFLGGLGLNHESAFRSGGQGRIVSYLGRFRGRSKQIYLTANQWSDGQLRIMPGMIELAEHFPALPGMFGSFKMTGSLDAEQFIKRSGFEVRLKKEVSLFESVLLLNRNGETFERQPLPQEIQWGRVWDIQCDDVNGDAAVDIVALLGYVSPHPNSPQGDSSFLSLFLGNGQGGFNYDSKRPTDPPIGNKVYKMDLTEGQLLLFTTSGERLTYVGNQH